MFKPISVTPTLRCADRRGGVTKMGNLDAENCIQLNADAQCRIPNVMHVKLCSVSYSGGEFSKNIKSARD